MREGSEPNANGHDLQESVDEPFDPFVCQICLDIAYKPVVLQACGHVFCFWCIRRSMNDAKPSMCPACRQPYLHFPRVCRLLHFLLEKAWPLHYQRKASETLAMEQSAAVFSPRILPVSTRGAGNDDVASSSLADGRKLHVYPEQADSDTGRGTVGVEDVSCVACGNLLYRPVVINCGEVVCELCWEVSRKEGAGSNPECWGCGSVHPLLQGASFRVCLALHQYLDTAFSALYNQRRLLPPTPPPLPTLEDSGDEEKPTSAVIDDDDDLANYEAMEVEDGEAGFVHVGVGCDECGMFPIVSRKRYHCVECGQLQIVGYDLCQCCYKIHTRNPHASNNSNTVERSSMCHHQHANLTGDGEILVGRFNQPHSPNLHHFVPMEVSSRRPDFLTLNFLRAQLEIAVPLDLNRGVISRRRRAHQVVMDDFDDYIDNLV